MSRKMIQKCLWATLSSGVPVDTRRRHKPAYSQSSTGEIQGTVTDQSGHAVQGANVAVISDSRVESTKLTGADGKFDITGIPTGSYTLEISAPGFSTIQRSVSIAAGSTKLAGRALRRLGL